MNETDQWVAPVFDRSLGNILTASVLGTIVIVTILGNILVILSFVLERRLWQPFNLYILNLAVTDFLIAITAMTLCTVDTILGYWPFGVYVCAVWIFFDYAMTFASVFTLVAISIDRLWCITWPMHFRAYNTNKKTTIILIIIWVSVIAVWTPPFIVDRLNHSEAHVCLWDPSKNKETVIFIDVVGYYTPCSIIILCYMRVFLLMRQQQSALTTLRTRRHERHRTNARQELSVDTLDNSEMARTNHAYEDEEVYPESEYPSDSNDQLHPNSRPNTRTSSVFTTGLENVHHGPALRNSRQKMRSYQRERRIFILLSYTLIVYILCWFPFYVTFDIAAWHPDLVPTVVYNIFFWSTYLNSTLNPFVYAYANPEFRSAFRRVKQRVFTTKS